MDISVILTIVTLTLVTLIWKKRSVSNGKNSKAFTKDNGQVVMPRVKESYPIFGSAPYLDRERYDFTLLNWAEKLGPMYRVNIFHRTWVVITNYEEMNEMLVTKGHMFAGRDVQFKLSSVTYGKKDVIHGNPTMSHWAPLRKAAHRGIRHYGNGMARLEGTLSEIASEFVTQVTTYKGEVIDLSNDIYNFVLKVTVTMISGRRVTGDSDENVRDMRQLDHIISNALTLEGIELDFYPWLRHFNHPTYKKILEVCKVRDRLWDSMWEESQKSYTSNGDASCIMHAIAQLTDPNSSHFDPEITTEHTRALFADLVIASILTTSSFLYVLPNVLLHNPEVLKRIQEEVDHVIGTDRQPSIFDRDSMPYCVATILELLRYGALVTSLPHVALEDSSLGGYEIPAGTIIFQLLPAVLHDKAFWGDPDIFRPDRFLNDDGSLLPADHPNRKHMLQFGAGPRVCIGEAFAQKRMFIFLTSLVQAFDLLPGDTLVPCDYKSYLQRGLMVQRPYTIKLMPRKAQPTTMAA